MILTANTPEQFIADNIDHFDWAYLVAYLSANGVAD